MTRHYSWVDQCLIKLDKTLRHITGRQIIAHARAVPGAEIAEPNLTAAEKKHVAGLMRVNYAGEVCAQALYQGQALSAARYTLKQQLLQASQEEEDHLAWCQQRLHQLNSRVSVLNPLWYGGSFALGVVAGLAGEQWNLGFLAETEKQVTAHLTLHLQQLPPQDHKTRTILQQMRDEEQQHATFAMQQGAKLLPGFIQTAMRFTAKIMTTTAYWI